MGTHLSTMDYGASLAVWDHTVLPATQHKWTLPAVSQPTGSVLDLPTPEGCKSWVDLGSLIAAQLGIEPTTAWLQVRRPNHYTTQPSNSCSADSKYWFCVLCVGCRCQNSRLDSSLTLTQTEKFQKTRQRCVHLLLTYLYFCHSGATGTASAVYKVLL